MNFGIIRYLLGRILMILSGLMVPSIVVGLIYREPFQVLKGFFITMVLCIMLGTLLSRKKPNKDDFYAREGLILVVLAWLMISLIGSLPYIFSGEVSSFIDALFESTSGFTTTGATVLPVEDNVLPHSLLFWRSFSLVIGGMGFLFFIISLQPTIGSRGIFIMRAELPGPNFGKLESRISKSIHILYAIYLSLILVVIILLRIGKVDWFESILLAFGTASTGGFNIVPESIAVYDSQFVRMVIAVAMMIFGMSFNLIYLLVIGKFKQFFKSEELRWYLGIIISAVLLISASVFPLYTNIKTMFQDVFFTTSSIITTTAYTTVDIHQWPIFAHIVLLFLMFSGGMSGSTSSGLKIARIMMFGKSIKQELRRMISPERAVPIVIEGKQIDAINQRSTTFYIITYLAVFLVLLALISIDTRSFTSAFNAVIATLNNVGHGADFFGASLPYSQLSAPTKLLMCLAMIMGRLEIYPVLLLFFPATWRKT